MDDDSTTDATNSSTEDGDLMDLSAEDNVGNDSDAATDETQTAGKGDDLASEDSETEDSAADDKTPVFDSDLDDWAEKTGHDKPETDKERKLMQDLRDSKREFTQKRQSKATEDLSKVIRETNPKAKTDDDTVDPLEKDVKDLKERLEKAETRQRMSEYLGTHDMSAAEQEAMKEILEERVAKGGQKAFDYLTDPENLGDWHDLAKLKLAGAADPTTEATDKARQEERERLAKISKSGGPSRSAKATTPAGKKDPLAELWESDD
jgi:hypothetical protein